MVGYVAISTGVSVGGRDRENGTPRRGVLQHHYLRCNRKYSQPSFPAALPLSLGAGAWPCELCMVSSLGPYSLASERELPTLSLLTTGCRTWMPFLGLGKPA